MRITRFITLAFTIILAACSVEPVRTYDGAPKSSDQVARLIVPGAITLDSVDGKDFSSPPDQTQPYDIELTPGRHIVAFQYVALWGAHDRETLVTSNYAAFDSQFVAGKTYRLEYDVPTDEYDAIERKNNFKPVLLVAGSNQKLVSKQYFGRDALRQSIVEKNAQATVPLGQVSTPVVDVNKLETKPITSTQSQALPDADTAVKEDAVKRLKFWWLMSSEPEREEFKRWMKTVDESFSDQKPNKQE